MTHEEPEPPDEFDDLREAWDDFTARLKDVFYPRLVDVACRVGWALERWRRG